MSPRHLLALAIGVSLAAHAVLLPPALWRWQACQAEKAMPRRAPREVTIPLAVVLSVLETPLLAKADALPYARTTENQQAAPPPRPDFQSDRDTQATSQQPPRPNGQGDLPSIAGQVDLGNEVETREFRDADFRPENPTNSADAAMPATEAQAAPAPEPEPVAEQPSAPPPPNEAPPPEEGDFPPSKPSESASTVVEKPPKPKAKEPLPQEGERPPRKPREPQRPAAKSAKAMAAASASAPSTVRVPKRAEDAFQPQTRKRVMDGAAKRLGDAAFNTAKTLMGEYEKQVNDAIDREWRRMLLNNGDFYSFSHLRVRFYLDRAGKVSDLEVLERTSNAVLTDRTLEAIMKAPIPKMPSALVTELEGGLLPLTIHFNMQ